MSEQSFTLANLLTDRIHDDSSVQNVYVNAT